MNEYMRMADRMYDLDNQFEQLKMKKVELEQENNNLLDVINGQEVKIADLESENAELKEDLEIQKKTVVEMVMPALDRTIKQLTKAKELLKELQGYIENEDDELYDKVEQFLRETDIDNAIQKADEEKDAWQKYYDFGR